MDRTVKATIILFLIIFKISYSGFAQKYDTVVHTAIYTSYFNNTLKVPVVVCYKLYKGGGNCNRKGMNFTNDINTIKAATEFDYRKSGYDRGHMANAEDFAYNCELMKLTFKYYNCIPQTPKLNRGIWKTNETNIRQLSQSDSLFIIIINHFENEKIGKNVGVPNFCIKTTYSLTTLKPISVFYVSNTNSPIYHESTLNQIDSIFSVNVEKFLLHYLKKR